MHKEAQMAAIIAALQRTLDRNEKAAASAVPAARHRQVCTPVAVAWHKLAGLECSEHLDKPPQHGNESESFISRRQGSVKSHYGSVQGFYTSC